MVELIGDPCLPSELVIPQVSGTQSEQPVMSGSIYMSGIYIYYHHNGVIYKMSGAVAL